MRHPLVASTALLHRLTLTAGLAASFLGCAEAPVQTGPDHVPATNVALAAAKDGKYATQAWPLVDDILIDWLDGAAAPGCAVGVSIDDEIVYLKGYGRARLGLAGEDWSVSTL